MKTNNKQKLVMIDGRKRRRQIEHRSFSRADVFKSLENLRLDRVQDAVERRSNRNGLDMEIELWESTDQRSGLLVREKRESVDTLDNRVKEFAKLFVVHFMNALEIYYHEARGEREKAGKIAGKAQYVGFVVGAGAGAVLGPLGLSGGASAGKEIVDYPATYFGKKNHKTKAKQINALLGNMVNSEDAKKKLKENLIDIALEIFARFEYQFTSATIDHNWDLAINKIAIDSVDRVMSYFNKKYTSLKAYGNIKKDFNNRVFEGVVEGESKEGLFASMIPDNLQGKAGLPEAGRTIKNKNGKAWNTSNLYSKPGIITISIEKGTQKEKRHFYKIPESDPEDYGFRLGFSFESKNLVDKNLLPTKANKEKKTAVGMNKESAEYEYELTSQSQKKTKLKNDILEELETFEEKVLEELKKINKTREQEGHKTRAVVEDKAEEAIKDREDKHKEAYRDRHEVEQRLTQNTKKECSELHARHDETQQSIDRANHGISELHLKIDELGMWGKSNSQKKQSQPGQTKLVDDDLTSSPEEELESILKGTKGTVEKKEEIKRIINERMLNEIEKRKQDPLKYTAIIDTYTATIDRCISIAKKKRDDEAEKTLKEFKEIIQSNRDQSTRSDTDNIKKNAVFNRSKSCEKKRKKRGIDDNCKTFDDSDFTLSPEEELISIIRGTAPENYKIELIKRLFDDDQEKKPNIDYEYKGHTALHIAASKGEIGVIKLLVELSAMNLSKWWPVEEKLPNTFVERKDQKTLVTKLHEVLEIGSAAVVQKATITGLGGIGKTTTAKWYADAYQKEYDHIFWIDSEGKMAVNQFKNLAEKLKITIVSDDRTPKDIKTISSEIYTKLKQKCQKSCLFIFDNADEYKDIEDLLTQDKSFHTLITSRNKNWGTKQGDGKIQQLELGPFSEQDAIDFIRGEKALGESTTKEDAKALAEELGRLPLALQQAVAYIKKTKETITNYLEKYKKASGVILNPGELDDYHKTVLKTWKLTLEKIKHNENFGELAIKILNIIAYLSPDDITKEMFEKLPEQEPTFLDDAIGLLNDSSMIKAIGEQIEIHRLVQEVARRKVREEGKEEETLREALILLRKNEDSEKKENNLRNIWKDASQYKSLVTELKDSANKALLDVAKRGDIDVLKKFINNGADINIRNKYGYTTLHLAAKGGNLDTVKFLIEKKADINAKISEKAVYAGYTALHLAAEGGNLDIVKFLIEQGANVNSVTKNGHTALDLAAKGGNLDDIVKFLIEQGTDTGNAYSHLEEVDPRMQSGYTPLHLAAQDGHQEAVEHLLKEGNAQVDVQNQEKETPLHLAAQNGHLAVVKTLLEKGAKVNARTQDGKTAWYLAAERGKTEVLEQLWKWGTEEVDGKPRLTPKELKQNWLLATDRLGKTAWYSAAERGNVAVLQQLWAWGTESVDGQPRLNPEELKRNWLLAKDQFGRTAWHLAAKEGETAVLQQLWAWGKESLDGQPSLTPKELKTNWLLAEDQYGQTAWHRAAERGNTEVLEQLWKWGQELREQHLLTDGELKDWLLATDKDGKTALHGAAERGNTEVLEQLWKWGQELREQHLLTDGDLKDWLLDTDRFGKTALHGAAKEGETAVLEQLWKWAKEVDAGRELLRVKITSRNKNWGTSQGEGKIEQLELGLFSEQEAIAFIKKEEALGSSVTIDHAKDLAQELGYLPLALQQAVAYIKKNKETITNYLEKYKKAAGTMLNTGELDDYHKTVLKTWQVTLEKIKDNKNFGELATKIFDIMAYLSPKGITKELLEKFPEATFLDDAIGLLNDYSMIKVTDGQIEVHRLVQEVVRIEIRGEGKEEETLKKAFDLITQSFPTGDTLDENGFTKINQLLPHSEALLTHINNWIKLETPENKESIEQNYLRKLLPLMGSAYGSLGNPQKQKVLLERALHIEEKHYGPEHYQVAGTLTNLGNAYGSLGNPQKQKVLLERALNIQEKHYGPEHYQVASTLTNLGNAYGSLGNPQKKKELLERALNIQEKHYGPEHYQVASTLTNLGNAYGSLGNPQKKKVLLERALNIQEKHYGPEHYQVARTLVNLGNAYGDLGNPQKQKVLLERALPIQEKYYGPEHYQVASTLVNLGNAYGDLGNPQKQKVLLERALPIQEKYYGPEHYQVASTLVNLGNAYGSLGKPQKQKALLELALPIFEKHYGPEHDQVARTLVNLGNAYGSLGKPQKQKALLERALAILEKHYGPEHYEIARILVNLGNAYGSLGKPQKQKELLELALYIQEKHYGPEHYQVAGTLGNLGTAYGGLGYPQKQKELLERALHIFSSTRGENHPDTINALNNLAATLAHQGEYDQALKRYKQVVEKRKEILGENHPDTISALNNLASTLVHQGAYDEALKRFNQVVEKRKEILGENHPDTISALNNLANTLDHKGAYDEALKLQKQVVEKRKEILGENHPDTLTALNNLASTLVHQGAYDEALKRFNQVVEKRKEILGENHPDTISALNNLASTLVHQGAYDEALKRFNQVVEKRKEILGENHPDTISALNNLASTLVHQGAYDEALKRFNQVVEKRKEILGENHPDTISALNNLASTLVHQGAYDEALKRFNQVVEKMKEILGENHPDTQIAKKNLAITLFKKGAYNEALALYNNDPLARDHHDTILHKAVSSGNDEAIRFVLDKIKEKDPQKALEHINTPDAEGDTPLMWAAEKGNMNAAKLLLEYGADINARDNKGQTALHEAATHHYSDFVQLLLDNRANPNIKDYDNKPPFSLAQEKLAQDPGNENLQTITDLLLSVTDTSQQQESGSARSGACPPSTSRRKKRNAEAACLLTWEDIDEFNQKQTRENVLVDSDKFIDYIKTIQSEEKRDQLIKFIETVPIVGNNKASVGALIQNQRTLNYLNKVGRVSGITMHGMMLKNTISDLLNTSVRD